MSTTTRYKRHKDSHQSQANDKSNSAIGAAAEKSQECVKKYPISSTMVALGAGAAFGLLIANAIGRNAEERRQSYLTSLGNNIACSLGKVVPDSLHWDR